ncbi:MAG: ABC transporter ATP-binding protein, partial [Mollicutes bacterium]|nr:ABC transporter ATP-binding protein [Mollicutes bacterium]
MLQLSKISKTYIKQTVLKDINLIFNKNEKVMIVGPSGSGKTTLLNVIFKLDKPSSGDILFKNKNILKINSNLYHTKIGFILQSYELIDDLNVLENIYLAQILNGKKDKSKVKSIIGKVGLEHVAYNKINTLSGGEKQRVAIARALVNEPDIILADEPTGSLDSSTSKEIMELIINLTKNKLLIMVTHNEYLAKKYGSRIITIQDGEIINDTNKQSKLNNDVFLEKRKKSINVLQIIKISLKNIFKNKVRFILTSLAVSIGLLGLSLVLLISDEANKELNYLEQNKIDSFPIVINKIPDIKNNNKEYLFPPYEKYQEEKLVKINSLTNKQLKYIENIDPTLLSGMSKQFLSNYLIMDEKYNTYEDKDIISLPISYKDNLFLTNNFDLVEGKYPKNNQEIVLIIDGNNQISNSLFNLIGNNAFSKKLKLINNDAI